MGAHTAVRLIEAGFLPVVYDNLSTGSRDSVDRIQAIAGARLDAVLARHAVAGVVHCAGLRSVTGSIANPPGVYAVNVAGTRSLCNALARRGIRRLVFSSSAAVYGETDRGPLSEHVAPAPLNPYGRSKLDAEEMLGAMAMADSEWRVVVLRLFNVGGAHESSALGEVAGENPECLLMRLAQHASGRKAFLEVYGDDYPTPDGTALRDYVHVEDVAAAHVSALQSVLSDSTNSILTTNIGRGKAVSVLEVVREFERASGRAIALHRRPRRAGDAACSYADIRTAAEKLNWRPERGLVAICRDAWRWQEVGGNLEASSPVVAQRMSV